LPRTRRKGKGDELCFAAPEAYFVDGSRDNMLLGGQQSIKAERSAKCRAEFVYGRIRDLVLRLRREHERDERCEPFILRSIANRKRKAGRAKLVWRMNEKLS
jgi:hypothetical protein